MTTESERRLTGGRMRKALPWVLAAMAAIAFGVTFSELTRLRARLRLHDHREVRQYTIRLALAEPRPIEGKRSSVLS